MAHTCGCCSTTADHGTTKTIGTIEGTQRVGDVARDYPGTVALMTELGVNHCCGAHLTLAEASAAAGIALDGLLDALNERARAAS